MEILLATPINRTHYCVPPLGLGYLVSALRKQGINSVSLLDCVKEKFDYRDFARFISQNKPRILGLQCYSFDLPAVRAMLEIAKSNSPDTITVIGGPHPSALAGTVLAEFPHLDFAIRGEGEESLCLFARTIFSGSKNPEFDQIPGLVFKKNGQALVNPTEFIDNLDTLNMPAWDTMDPRTYPDIVQGGFYEEFPVASIITSRGCPYSCTFCANKIHMGKKIRFRSVENVFAEIRFLVENYKVREIHILDDNFTFDRKRVFDFCAKIEEEGLRIHFAFPNGIRIDAIDSEILSALKKIGVYSITVGIESGSQRILNHMQKGLSLEEVKGKANLIKKKGFTVNAFFIIGYPQENKEDILCTIKFAQKLPLDFAHFSCFLPLPGTDITNDLLSSGELKEINYAELFYAKTPFSPPGITQRQLKSLQQKAFFAFYLRPRILLGLILRLKSFRHLRAIMKRAADYILPRGKS